MTEQEWLASSDPFAMLQGVERIASDRKLRLYACACCRQVLNQFVPARVVGAIVLVESFADGRMKGSILAHVEETMNRDIESTRELNGSGYLAHIMKATAGAAADVARYAAHRARISAAHAANDSVPHDTGLRISGATELTSELAAQVELLRDIFGNPFRELVFDSTWRTSDVLAMARGMYANRDFSAMPILADALQEAGCDNDDVLIHCREEVEHARGCWVVDLLLGKM